MPRGPEHVRADKWVAKLKALGWWMQKVPGSSLAGIPDYIRGHPDHGLIHTEAKTLEAVIRKGPRKACSRAQQYYLDQVVRCRGRASLLILDEEGYCDLDWRDLPDQWSAYYQAQHRIQYVADEPGA